MEKVFIEKTIFVKDKYGVVRQAFLAGTYEKVYVVRAVAKADTVLNPDDLPEEFQPIVVDQPIEHKMLIEEPEVWTTSTTEEPAAVAEKPVVKKGKKDVKKDETTV